MGQHTEARQILSTCTAATPRPLLAWACGVLSAGHALYFYRLPVLPAYLGSTYRGESLDSGRMFVATTEEARVTEARGTVVTVRWPEVVAVLRPEVVAEYHPRIVEAMDVRRARVDKYDPGRKKGWYHSPEAAAQRELWCDIEQMCGALADEVWAACRPGAQAEQLDLFGLL